MNPQMFLENTSPVLRTTDHSKNEIGMGEDEEDEEDEDDFVDEDDEDEDDEQDDDEDEDVFNASLEGRPNSVVLKEDGPNQVLSVKLIALRGLGEKAMSKMSMTEIAEAVLELKHIRLDGERIAEIDNMEALGTNVTHLYLQRNRITRIENLESLQHLQVCQNMCDLLKLQS